MSPATRKGKAHRDHLREVEMPSESYRSRQVHRYYRAWQEVQDLLHEDTASGQAEPFSITPEDHVPRSSQDRALTAFAQLATLRLNAKRTIISLIDTKRQYILAEATQSISLIQDTQFDVDDELSFGKSVLPRDRSLCSRGFDSKTTIADEDGNKTEINALLTGDALEDERFKDNELVQEKRIRFFATVPISTRSGIKIGAYSVLSTETRPDLTFKELKFLQDVSSTVFEHLVLAKGRLDSVRGARMVQGLTSFIENAGTPGAPSVIRSRNADSQDSDLLSLSADGESDLATTGLASRLSGKRVSRRSHQANGSDSTVKASPASQSTLAEGSASDTSRFSYSAESLTGNTSSGGSIRSLSSGADSTASTVYSDSKRMFAQAADILRRSTLADGCIFFDATSRDLDEGPSSRDHQTKRRRSKAGKNSDHESRSDSSLASTDDTQSDSDKKDTSDSDSSSAMKRQSDILGLSLTQAGINSNNGVSTFTFLEQDLKRCIRRYPRGKIFNFTDQGTISSGEDTLSDRSHHGKTSQAKTQSPSTSRGSGRDDMKSNRVRRFVAEEITRILPGVTSVIFLPLWEFSQDRWYAGAFLWTTQIGHLMDPNDEFPYIRAFGNTVMSEVSRLDALHAERAKTTFIASISHELRSPLHGILGSIEFLHDTVINSFQQGLITSIETCGKTLLDTIDHVLDFAKINSFGHGRSRTGQLKGRRTHRSEEGALSKMTLTSSFDLCVLVEEVVDAIYAGQTFRRHHAGASTGPADYDDIPNVRTETHKLTDDAGDDQIAQESGKFAGRLSVILDIDRKADWTVRSQPGALRRIVMNLFGNALKYTDSGFVRVTLRPSKVKTPRPSRTSVDLVFTDSGKGMSEEYLRDRLYKPFSQEDPFSIGTGLGLSIVRQIVTSLHGRIDIQSEQGKGTEITVSLNLPTVEHVEGKAYEDLGAPLAKITNGLKVCVLKAEVEGADATSTEHILEHTLKGMYTDWFGMKYFSAKNMDEIEADLFVYAEPPAISNLLAQHKEGYTSAQKRSRDTPLIVICTNAFEAAALRSGGIEHMTDLGRVIEIVSQPAGPMKMSKVLERCFRDVKTSHPPETLEQGSTSNTGAVSSDTASREAVVAGSPSHLSQEQPAPETKVDPRERNETDKENSAIEKPSSSPRVSSNVIAIRDSRHRRIPSEGPQPLSTQNSDPSNSSTAAGPDLPFVLLVDDNPINLQLLVTFMKKISHQYVSAVNGLEALNFYKDHYQEGRYFNYVLMDISMPIMDGLTSTQEIRKFEREKGKMKTTIVALTGLAGQATQEEAFRTGFDHFFPKPVRFKELKKLLKVE